MAQKDGTGPQGKGPRTGRGMGNCAPQMNQGDQKKGAPIPQSPRRGQGQGRGMGRRQGN